MATDKPTAKAHAYQFLHAVCATAVSDGLLASNPCNVPKAMATTTKRQAVILEPAEVAALADAMPERLRALVLTAAWCAPRWAKSSSCAAATSAPTARSSTIARGATHRAGQCHIDTPKSGRGRKVVVPPHIRADLADHLARHVAEAPGALLFPPIRGGCHLNDKVFRDDCFVPALAKIGRDGEDAAPTDDSRFAPLRRHADRPGRQPCGDHGPAGSFHGEGQPALPGASSVAVTPRWPRRCHGWPTTTRRRCLRHARVTPRAVVEGSTNFVAPQPW